MARYEPAVDASSDRSLELAASRGVVEPTLGEMGAPKADHVVPSGANSHWMVTGLGVSAVTFRETPPGYWVELVGERVMIGAVSGMRSTSAASVVVLPEEFVIVARYQVEGAGAGNEKMGDCVQRPGLTCDGVNGVETEDHVVPSVDDSHAIVGVVPTLVKENENW
ncbi:MAG TPA: hypothetical protein VNS19_05045 [Acidimicrobiales bacterium]|nr:hypothetical protein [Acidimicrobiales bacterium]